MIRFSVVTVTYNAAATVEATLRSVQQQDYAEVESLVLDGASTDGTVALLKAFAQQPLAHPLVFQSAPDKGLYDAMNKGIRLAHERSTHDGLTRYVLMLNADDTLYAPDVLSRLAAFLHSQPTLPDVLCGSWALCPDHGEYICHPGSLSLLPRKYVICHQATLVQSHVLAENLFDLRYRWAGDFHQLSSLYLKHYTFALCPDITVSRVVLGQGATTDHWQASMHEAYDILRERGLYHTGEETLMYLRKSATHLLHHLSATPIGRPLFRWLAHHYKPL